MRHSLKQRKQDGFTIIEVLIVLAIAGLILLVVFLAVPALQRNSRNTQRRTDVAAVLGAVSEFANNSNGTLPVTDGTVNASFTNANPNLGYYTTAANVTWDYNAAATATGDPDNLDKVVVANFAKCNAAGTAAVTSGATTRSIVALYDVEGSGGSKVPQCKESGA